MKPVLDLRGTADTQGRILEVTEIAQADEIAAAAELAMGKASGIAAVLVRGVAYQAGDGRAADMVRAAAEDMFR
jgi:coenzyme F420-0:L-glutamate ligase/coenzyme F420-1:gamma-L-glutamate ligase